jgi:hypothetical protein
VVWKVDLVVAEDNCNCKVSLLLADRHMKAIEHAVTVTPRAALQSLILLLCENFDVARILFETRVKLCRSGT